MLIELDYTDIRKVATMFRRQDVALTDCCKVAESTLRFTVRVDAAKHVEAVAAVVKTLPVTVAVDIAMRKSGNTRVILELGELDLDKREMPLLVRPLLSAKLVRKLILQNLKVPSWIQPDRNAGSFDVNLLPPLQDRLPGASLIIKSLKILDDSLALELQIGQDLLD